MKDAKPHARESTGDGEASLAAALAFFGVLFDPSDTILFRPIESWVEAGTKRSRVDYRHTCYQAAEPDLLRVVLADLLCAAEAERTNLYFGVCPRVGGKGRFDLAWQIRTVRALWADIDHVAVDEARTKIEQAGLPAPSILVGSGNGVHAYWLLDEPYQIDDAGDPPPVETEWTQSPDDRKKPRKYLIEDGERIYLDRRRHVPRLSPKAELIQGTLAGIAKAIGGDHTTDLSRLLRVPGSLNRKDERNGREPIPTELVECDPSRRYALTVFETLRLPSPEAERTKKILAMPLPRPRKLSISKADRLAELIATCGITEPGRRSEADFAVCCYAIRYGISREELWRQLSHVGKFAEQGERYFDVTWEKAEFEVRAQTFEKIQKTSSPKSKGPTTPWEEAPFGEGDDSRPTITVDPTTMPVADTMAQVTDRLLAVGSCFSRSDQLVAIHDHKILPILSPPELGGLLNQHVEFYFVNDVAGEFRPFPPSLANVWLNNHVERNRLPVIKLFTHNPVFTNDWRLVQPGFDAESGIYYAGPAVDPRLGTKHLDQLLQDFCFRSVADRTNYLGVLLTTLLMPRFIGSKPAVLFNGNQPELGKSILAQIISILRDGQAAETATYNSNDEEFEKRLGAIVRRGATTIIIDNAKARGRHPRIESSCLERSITDPVLSFRLLGQSASIRAENSHMFCITANAPDVSRDLVTRSVVVNLHYEGDPERRTFEIADPEGYAQQHRLELLGELIGMVERWKSQGQPQAKIHSRFNKRSWGNIVGGILEACGEPDFLANAEEDAAQLDETRREFAELVSLLADHQQGTWTAAELVTLCGTYKLMAEDLGDGSPRSLATKLGTIAGRYLAERFPLANGRFATFHRADSRKGKVYRVTLEDQTAEP